MIHHIRPHKLFSLLEDEGFDRTVQIRISKRRGLAWKPGEADGPDVPDGSLTYLETMIVLTACKLVRAFDVLEFGTHLGSTTTNIALNLPFSGRIETWDTAPLDKFKEWNHFDDLDENIKSIQGDTRDFKSDQTYDFIWIDGNTNRYNDTHMAFKYLNDSILACIGWHDYGKPEVNTTEVVEGLVTIYPIYHIEDSSVCLYFNREVPLC